jgi:hypothetical protein
MRRGTAAVTKRNWRAPLNSFGCRSGPGCLQEWLLTGIARAPEEVRKSTFITHQICSHAPTTVVQQKPGTLFGLSTSMLASQIQLLRLSRIILWVHVGETPWTVAVKLHNCVLIREHVVLHARRHREETTHWQNLSLALIRIRSRT